MQNHRDSRDNSSYFEHSPTARGPLADFARTPLYPPAPSQDLCGPTPDGRCICGASSSRFKPEYTPAVRLGRPSPLFSNSTNSPIPRSNPFTDEEPDYSSIRPGFAQRLRSTALVTTPVYGSGSSGLPSEESPSSAYPTDSPPSAYSDDAHPMSRLVPFEHNGVRYYPESTRRPTALDQAQAEVARMLQSQPPLTPHSTPLLPPAPSLSDDEVDFMPLSSTPPSPPRRSRSSDPDEELMMALHWTLNQMSISGDDDEEPSSSYDHFFAGFGCLVEPRSPLTEHAQSEHAHDVAEEEYYDAQEEHCDAQEEHCDAQEEEQYDAQEEEGYDAQPAKEEHMLPGILQLPHPVAPDGVNPQAMWVQALSWYDLLDRVDDLFSDPVKEFLEVMRETDEERRRLVSDIKLLRSDIIRHRRSRRDSARDESLDDSYYSLRWKKVDLMVLISRLSEHDDYHWPMLTPCEYGADEDDWIADDEFERIVPHEPIYMALPKDWNPNFDWVNPFGPRRGDRIVDEVPLSPKSKATVAWNPNFSWSRPFALRRGRQKPSADDDLEAPLSPKTR